MCNKYSPDELLSLSSSHYFLEDEYKKAKEVGDIAFGGAIPTHEYRIFIKLKSDPNMCFLIAAEKDNAALLYRGKCATDIWRLQQNETELFEQKDDLGETIIQRNGINREIFSDYESCWERICKR